MNTSPQKRGVETTAEEGKEKEKEAGWLVYLLFWDVLFETPVVWSHAEHFGANALTWSPLVRPVMMVKIKDHGP